MEMKRWAFFFGGGAGGEHMPYNFVPLRSHSHFVARSRFAVDVHSLALAKERTKKASGGYAPQPRAAAGGARKPLRCSASLRKARLEFFVRRKFSVLFGTASKTGLAGD